MDPSISIPVGTGAWRVRVAAGRQVPVHRRRRPRSDAAPLELLAAALDRPDGIDAPLRQAFTPDDRVTIVVDEQLPGIGELLRGFLEHIAPARIDPRNVTLLVANSGPQLWLEELPDEYGDIHVEVHNPTDREKLAYLATTKGGRRVYLNRTLVDADAVVVLSARRFDAILGYAGGEAAVFPALADEEAQKALAAEYRKEATRKHRARWRNEALEVLALLGSSFLVQVVEAERGGVAAILVGMAGSVKPGIELLREHWLGTVDAPADLVVASVSGPTDSTTFGDLSAALANGKRVLASQGRLILLTEAAPALDDAAEILRKAGSPAAALKKLTTATDAEPNAAVRWARSATDSHLFVKSGWPADVVEDLFATPLKSEGELQRLIDAAERVAILPDAHRMRAKTADAEGD
jgi:nickel-dependent lactate racemase